MPKRRGLERNQLNIYLCNIDIKCHTARAHAYTYTHMPNQNCSSSVIMCNNIIILHDIVFVSHVSLAGMGSLITVPIMRILKVKY